MHSRALARVFRRCLRWHSSGSGVRPEFRIQYCQDRALDPDVCIDLTLGQVRVCRSG